MVIYKATNLINGKVYIGQTARPLEVRMAEHARHTKLPFDRAVNKYGLENFKVEVIDHAETVEELNRKEIYWIKQYNSFGENGYNLCEGGGNTKGYHHTEESKRRMSEHHKGMFEGANNPFYGKQHSEATKAKWIGKRVTKTVKVRNIDTGEIFNMIKEAANKYGVEPTHITRVCKGKRKTAGGYRWEYV